MDRSNEPKDPATATSEHRLHLRRTPAILAYVEMGEDNGGLVLNLSEEGLAVQSAVPILREQLSRLRFQIPGGWDWVETNGQIAWISESRKEAGIRFVNVPEAVRLRIANWVLSESGADLPSVSQAQQPTVWEEARNSVSVKLDRNCASAQAGPADTGAGENFWAPLPPVSPSASDFLGPSKPPSPSSDPFVVSGTIDPAVLGRPHMKTPPPINLSFAKPHAAMAAGPTAAQFPGLASTRSESPAMGAINRSYEEGLLNNTTGVAKSSRRLTTGLLVCFVAAGSMAAGIGIGNGSLTQWLPKAEAFVHLQEQRIQRWEQPSALNPANPESAAFSAAASASSVAGAGANDSPNHLPANLLPSTRDANAEPTPPIEQQTLADPPDANADALTLPADQSQVGILISAPEPGQPALRLNVPPAAVSASSSIAVSSQRSLMVQPIPRGGEYRRTERLQIGNLQVFVEPEYPAEAKEQQIEGTVELEATINKDGTVRTIRFVSGARSLAQSAINAITAWRYKPTLLDGQPVETQDDITIEFRLP